MAKKRKGNPSSKKINGRPKAPDLSWKPFEQPAKQAPAPAAVAAQAPVTELTGPSPALAPAEDRPAEPSARDTLDPMPAAAPLAPAPAAQAAAPEAASEAPPVTARTASHEAASPSHDDAEDPHEEAFFNQPAHEEIPPTASEIFEESEQELVEPPSPEVLHRRMMFRKGVSMVIGMAASLALAMGIKTASARSTPAEAFTAVAQQNLTTHLAVQTQAAPAKVEARVEARAAEPAARPAEPVAKAAEPEAKPAEAKPAEAKAAEPEAKPAGAAQGDGKAAEVVEKKEEARPDPAQAKELTKQALSLLERGKFKEAIEKASASIEADPTDANPYMYWGTALMETGKMKEAKAVFGRCTESATRGPKHECRQFK